jgi:hypothetical protein
LKSHHQIEFFENYLDFLFENYYVIYLKREIKDVLLSYYRFLNDKGNKNQIKGFPALKDWIFMSPDYVGKKILGYENFPDPHVIIQPKDYIDRWMLHIKGWEKHGGKFLTLTYEDILNNFSETKEKIENFINKKISDKIPDIKDKNLPNISPNKGIIGAYKDCMDDFLIKTIDNRINFK